jgi:hypothetical protein
MQVNDVFDSVVAPIHGAPRGQVATVHPKAGDRAGRSAVLALIKRFRAAIVGRTSDNALALVFAPAGASNTIDSLYWVRQLVTDPATATTELPELLDCTGASC